MASKRYLTIGMKSRDESQSKKAKSLANEIHEACMEGEIEKVKSFLKETNQEPSIIEEISKKETLINLSQNGKTEILKELLKNSVNPNCTNDEGQTPLHIACHYSHVDVVMALLNHGANVNAENNKKECPLVWIDVWKFNEEVATIIARKLLEHGADINAQTKYGDTLLSSAAAAGNFSLVIELLKNGADVNIRDKNGQTPLHDVDNCDIVRELIKYGASMNTKDRFGNTPLHTASVYGHISGVKELLRHKAKLKSSNNLGYTPIYLAYENRQARVIKEFLEHSLRTKKQVIEENLLHFAAMNGQIEIVSTILEHGVEVDQRDGDYDNTTPLHDAAEKGQLAIVKLLLIYGADINAQKDNGETVLHTVLHGRNLGGHYSEQKLLKVMEELLDEKYKINLKLKCSKGLTPLETAIKLGRLKMARRLSKFLCSEPKITDSIYPLKHLL